MAIEEEKNNAPAPGAMRLEFINIMRGRAPGKLTFEKAGEIVDAILEKQMRYYAQMAETEVDNSAPEFIVAVGELAGRAAAVINIGAEFVQFMSAEKRQQWQQNAQRLRDTCKTLENML